MFLLALILVPLFMDVNSAKLNTTCPVATRVPMDLKQLDGTWYIYAAAESKPNLEGECASIRFKHQSSNSTDLSIRWINNNTTSYYNGSAELMGNATVLHVTYSDSRMVNYSLLTDEYIDYAVLFSCRNDNSTASETGPMSTYELLKLVRKQHPEQKSIKEMDEAENNLNLLNPKIYKFNNTEECCKTNDASSRVAPSLAWTSIIAMSILKRL